MTRVAGCVSSGIAASARARDALLVQVSQSGPQEIGQRYHAHQTRWILAADHREASQTSRGHALDDDAERFIRIGDDRIGLAISTSRLSCSTFSRATARSWRVITPIMR